jgi:hypothetical protein
MIVGIVAAAVVVVVVYMERNFVVEVFVPKTKN